MKIFIFKPHYFLSASVWLFLLISAPALGSSDFDLCRDHLEGRGNGSARNNSNVVAFQPRPRPRASNSSPSNQPAQLVNVAEFAAETSADDSHRITNLIELIKGFTQNQETSYSGSDEETYILEQFALSSRGRWLAMILPSELTPHLIENGTPLILAEATRLGKVGTTLKPFYPPKNFRFATKGLSFLGNTNILVAPLDSRSQYIGDEGPVEFLEDIMFIDPDRAYAPLRLSEFLGKMTRVQRFGAYHYQISRVEGSRPELAYFNPMTGEAFIYPQSISGGFEEHSFRLGDEKEFIVGGPEDTSDPLTPFYMRDFEGIELRANPATKTLEMVPSPTTHKSPYYRAFNGDETGVSYYVSSDGIFVGRYLNVGAYDVKEIYPLKVGDLVRSVQFAPRELSIVSEGRFSIFDLNNRQVVQSWSMPEHRKLSFVPYKVKEGYLAFMPNYATKSEGWYLFKLDGTVVPIFEGRLIHDQIRSDSLSGISLQRHYDPAIDLHRIELK